MSDDSPFKDLSTEDTLQKLQVSPDQGLSANEVQSRLKQYGENELQEKKVNPLLKLLSFFWGPIPWMIEIAAILSGLLQRWPDLIIISSLLVINAAIGFFQEFKADNAIEELKKKLALKARVLRDGKWQEVDAKSLVPGDILNLRLGNIIPADAKLLSGEYLSIDQSTLTGESLPADKKGGEMAFSGTVVKLGEMQAVVTETGANTFFGKTAQLVSEAKTVSHFHEAVLKIGHFLIFATLSVAAILLIYFFVRLEITDTLHESFGDIFIFILILIIAGIPVALPAVLSSTLAIGANQMAKFKAIVSKLSAIEELAGMDILCSDKTGTLTKNELTIQDIFPFGGASKEDVLLFGCLASSKEGGDTIDEVLFQSLGDKSHFSEFTCTKFIPFDPTNKKTEATLQSKEGKTLTAYKGAPQVILDLSHPQDADTINQKIEELASQGLRTLGVARSSGEKTEFLGLIALYDPPREDTKQTLQETRSLGVSVKMVTGDHTAIAKVIGKELEIGTNILPMQEVFSQEIDDAHRDQMLESADGFAQVYPQHKFALIQHLQAKKHIVGMTGDGVNDAPALKQADIGIAVSNATDAARAAADLVLTQPGLMVITKAIEEARYIFGRMKSYAIYRVSETVRLLLFLLLAILIFHTHPLTSIMIVVIALLNDIPIMMIAYDHMAIRPKPYSWDMREVLFIAVGLAIVGVVSTFGLYWISQAIWQLGPDKSRTLAFMAILCGGNLTIYLTRNRRFFWDRPFPEWKFFLATFFSQAAGTLASVYGLGTQDFVGIGWKYAGLAWIYILIWFFLCAMTKSFLYYLLSGKHFEKKFFSKIRQKLHR